LIVVGSVLATLLAVQSVADAGPAPCRFDTAASMAQRTVAIGLAPGWRAKQFSATKPVPQTYLFAADAVRQYYKPPAIISLPFWAKIPTMRTIGDSLDTVGQGLDGVLMFRLTATGQLADTNIFVATASPEFNASLVSAIRRADSASAFPLPDGEVKRDNGRIILRIADVNRADSTAHAIGLVRIAVPILAIDQWAERLNDPPMSYPDVSIEEGENDDVTVQFVVNTNGRADTASLRILQGGHREFMISALQALAATRFKPASIGGCPVPQLVQQQYTYRTWIRCSVAGAC
jgi:TonB family protein